MCIVIHTGFQLKPLQDKLANKTEEHNNRSESQISAKNQESLIWNPYFAAKYLQTMSTTQPQTNLKTLYPTINLYKEIVQEKPFCADYLKATLVPRKVYPNFYGSNCESNSKNSEVYDNSITLTSQMDLVSEGYWEKLRKMIQHWNGPVSVALYTMQRDESVEKLRQLLKDVFSKFNLAKALICIHLMVEPLKTDTSIINVLYYALLII